MNALRQFTIPIKGLKTGIHTYDFSIADDFFSNFEESPIKEGKFEVKFYFDKREDMLVLTFDFKGSFKTECDRCLANINLPVDNNDDLIIKFAEEADDSKDVIYISKDTSELNIAKYMYEAIILSMPVTNIYENCEEDEVCDIEMLNRLDQSEEEDESTEDTPDSDSNSPWDILKDFNKN